MLLSKHKHLLRIFASFALFIGILLPARLVAAEAYGSGAYDSCDYSQTNCPTTPAASSSSSSGSSGGGTTTPATTPAPEILLNDFDQYFASGGKTLDLQPGQVVYFNVDVGGTTEKHSITIQEVGSDYVVIIILRSTPQTVRLTLGETGQYDVNGDGINDIQITLNSITNGKANLTFKNLGKATKTVAKTTQATTAAAKKNWVPIAVFSAILLAGLLLFLWLFIKRRKRKKEIQF